MANIYESVLLCVFICFAYKNMLCFIALGIKVADKIKFANWLISKWERGPGLSRWGSIVLWWSLKMEKEGSILFREMQPERRGFPGGTSGKEPTCQCRR